MGESYTLREPINRGTLLEAMEVVASKLNLDFSIYSPIHEPRHSRNKGVLLQRRFENSGLRGIILRLLPQIQFSFTALLLCEQVDSLDFLLFDGNPIEFGIGGQKHPLMDQNHPEYGAAKSLLNSYMEEVYGRLNELHNQARNH